MANRDPQHGRERPPNGDETFAQDYRDPGRPERHGEEGGGRAESGPGRYFRAAMTRITPRPHDERPERHRDEDSRPGGMRTFRAGDEWASRGPERDRARYEPWRGQESVRYDPGEELELRRDRGEHVRYRDERGQVRREPLGRRTEWSGVGGEVPAEELRPQERRHRRWARESVTADEVMTRDVKAVGREASLRQVAEIMRSESCGIVPVVDAQGRLLGLITDRDMVMRTYTSDKPWSGHQAQEVMTEEVEGVTPGTPVREVISLMGQHQVRRVPVVDRQDRLMGMISLGDIATRADRDEELQEALEHISSRRSFWSRLWS